MISRSDKWGLVLSILVFVLVAALSLPAAAETLTVAKTGAQFDSVQAAIDSADPGDTVQVKEGTYKENLSVDKGLTLKGVGASKVKIDGRKEGYPVLHVGPSEVEVTVKGLTLRGAEGSMCKDYKKKHCTNGLAAVGDSELRVKRATISGNGIGIGLRDSARATVVNSNISENKVGIGLSDSAQATVQNNSIRRNNIGIKIYEPENFKGTLEGSPNQIEDNDTIFKGISESTREELVGALVVTKTGAQFPSIQAAIDSADPGDTVKVREGTYKVNLSIDKDLTLKGAGTSKVKLDGRKEGYPVLHVGPSEVEVTVKGLTLRGAEGDDCKDEKKGICPHGLAAVGDSEIKVKGVTISGNEWSGIEFWDSARATVRGNSIRKNNTGIKIYKPKKFEGSLEGFGNRMIDNGMDFVGVPKSTREELVS